MLARRVATVEQGMYLVGTLYNFCCAHSSLGLAEGRKQTPAMASGITNHVWSIRELLWYKVAPPAYVPPKKRGRPPKFKS